MSFSIANHKKTLRSSIVAILAIVIVGGVSAYLVNNASANHATNPGKVAQGGVCGFNKNPVPAYAWFDFCTGATWQYYSFSGSYTGITINDYTATVSGSANMPGGKIGPCKWTEEEQNTEPNEDGTYGTHEVEKHTSGFFRLGLVSYNPATFKSTGSILASLQAHSQYGSIVGLLADSSLQEFSGAGGVPYLQIPGSMSFADAHTKYNEAVASGKELGDGVAWGAGLGGFCYDTSWSGGSSMPTPIVPTPPSNDPSTNTTGGTFRSQSTVVIDKQNDVSARTETSDDDGTVKVRLSTDASSFTGKFHHQIFWQNDMNSSDYFWAPATNWKITRSVTGRDGGGTKAEGRVFQVAENKGGTSDSSGNICAGESCDDSFTVSNLKQGETVTVCDTISYDPKYVSFWQQSGSHMWHQGGQSGSGSSTACFEITRPEDPTGDTESTNTVPSGDAYGTIMYTGQDATVKWGYKGDKSSPIKSKNIPTRRVKQYKEIVYLVKATQTYNNNLTVGNLTVHYPNRNPDDPCKYYTKKNDTVGCTSTDKNKNTSWATDVNTGTSTMTKQYTLPIVVPDYVGYKYCNSAGWKFEYWVGVYKKDSSGKETTAWTHENKDYWTTYDASCRTIAKKPSMSIWNGSTMTNGGARAAMSKRYHDTALGRTAKGNGNISQYEYGSWPEYLAVVGKGVNGFSSGSAFALGSSALDLFQNSPLTISNSTTALGQSGISTNSTLRTRLDTFLKDRATKYAGGTKSSNIADLSSNVSGTHIYHINGDLTIDKNIILSTGPSDGYSSIYDLPQVIFFVDNDVKVKSDVTRIDAWIIANGTIDTCSDFVAPYKSETETNYGTDADAVNRLSSSGVCMKQLVFNGPIMASNLKLQRSYGSDPKIHRSGAYLGSNSTATTIAAECSGDEDNDKAEGHKSCSKRYSAGEIFNFRTDSYLWAYAQAGRYDSSYTETYTRELAPRY